VPVPQYAHLPVAVNAEGQKLSKQTLAQPLDDHNPLPALMAAFRFLGMAGLEGNDASLEDVWEETIRLWSLDKVPKVRAIRMG
jgi:glutamyl-Q tRNA(Asp) synthetase